MKYGQIGHWPNCFVFNYGQKRNAYSKLIRMPMQNCIGKKLIVRNTVYRAAEPRSKVIQTQILTRLTSPRHSRYS